MWTRRDSSRQRFERYRSHPPGTLSRRGTELLHDRDPRARASRPFGRLISAFWRLLEGHRGVMAASLATLTVATLVGLTLPASTKVVIDYILTDSPGPTGIPDWTGLPQDRRSLLWIVAGAMVVLAGISVTVGMWGRWQMTRVTKRVEVRLRRRAFDHAVRLPLHRVHEIRSGGVASLLRDDAGGAGQMIFALIYNPWRAVIQLAGALIVLVAVDWRLLVGATVLIPLVWVTHRTWINRIRPRYRDIRKTRQAIDAGAAETFGGMRVVRGFGRERSETGSFVSGNHFMARQELLTWWRARAIDVAWSLLIPILSAAVLVYGGIQVLEGTLTVGDVMMFSAYLLMLLGPIEALAASATNMQNNLAGLDRLLDLFEEPLEFSHQSPAGEAPKNARGAIALRGVTFAYPAASVPVLREIDLDVRAGETVALVGSSGAGKTTLCNLVARFYDPSEGAALLDGVDLRDYTVDSYRRLLGIVEQDVFLFDGTVTENIGYARTNATFDEVVEAARAANADAFIRAFEEGYETVIGERGVRLSGGQKQRIAIARALLADPRVLILDEATSNLDTESERMIQASLERLMRGRTCFVIAHRLSTVRDADRIVVLEGGRIVEAGAHDELLARGGRYADLLRMQVRDDAETLAQTEPTA